MSQKHMLLGIVIGAAVVRLALFALVLWQDQPGTFALGDTQGYVLIADNLIAGHGYSMATTSPYLPDSIRTPAIPYLFAATKAITGSFTPFILVQIALALVLVYLTYRIALEVTGKERLALFAAALMAFEPYSVFINLSLLTETVFALCITAGAYCTMLYIRDRSLMPLAAASALCALAALTRPIAQFLPLLLVLLILCLESWRSYAKYIALAIVPFLIVAAPWVMRNYEAFGVASFSSAGYSNVYSNLGSTIISYRDGTNWDVTKKTMEADFATRHHIPLSTIQQNLALSPILFREGLLIMINNPGATVMSFVSVAIAFFTNDAWSYYFDHWNWIAPFEYGFSPTYSLLTEGPLATLKHVVHAAGPALAIPLIGRLFWLAVTCFLFVGLALLMREKGKRRTYALVVLFSILYYLALSWSAGTGVNGRYRYPINPLIFTVAVYGAWYAVGAMRRMMKRIRTV